MSWAAAASFAGSAFDAFGSLYSGMTEAAGYRAMATAKKKEAAEAVVASKWDQARILEEGRRLTSTQRAVYGQAGVAVEGTPTDVMVDTRREVTMEKLMRARTGRVQQQALLEEARQYRKAASAAETKGVLGALGSFF